MFIIRLIYYVNCIYSFGLSNPYFFLSLSLVQFLVGVFSQLFTEDGEKKELITTIFVWLKILSKPQQLIKVLELYLVLSRFLLPFLFTPSCSTIHKSQILITFYSRLYLSLLRQYLFTVIVIRFRSTESSTHFLKRDLLLLM